MKRVVLVLALVMYSTGAFSQTVFRAPLQSLDRGRLTVSFGKDAYRIDSRDQTICEEWKVQDPCKITEEGSRPETFARIYNERTRDWVRGTRLKDEADLLDERDKLRGQDEVSRIRKDDQQEARIKEMAKRQNSYTKLVVHRLESGRAKLAFLLAELDRNAQLLHQTSNSFRRIALNKRIRLLQTTIGNLERQVRNLEKEEAWLRSHQP